MERAALLPFLDKPVVLAMSMDRHAGAVCPGCDLCLAAASAQATGRFRHLPLRQDPAAFEVSTDVLEAVGGQAKMLGGDMLRDAR